MRFWYSPELDAKPLGKADDWTNKMVEEVTVNTSFLGPEG